MSKLPLFFLCLGFLGTAVASDLDFTLVNQTGRSFEAVYLSSTDDSDWDGNLLRDDKALTAGKSLEVKFGDTEKPATWDLKVIDSDGVAVTFKAVNLSETDTVTLTGKDGDYSVEVE